MDKYLINPIVFYLINVADNFSLFCCLAGAISTVVFMFFFFMYLECMGKEEEKFAKKIAKTSLFCTIFFAVALVLLPDRQTMYTMIVAHMMTYENISLTKESAMQLIDYIVEQVGKLSSN